MLQKKINIARSFHSEIFGKTNQNLDYLKTHFSKLKIILRDEDLNVIGDSENVNSFMKSWKVIEDHHSKFNNVSESTVKSIIEKKYDLNHAKFSKNKDKQVKAFNNYIKNLESKKNLIFVTHYVFISEVLNYGPSSGEIVVSDKNLNIIGSIEIDF